MATVALGQSVIHNAKMLVALQFADFTISSKDDIISSQYLEIMKSNTCKMQHLSSTSKAKVTS